MEAHFDFERLSVYQKSLDFIGRLDKISSEAIVRPLCYELLTTNYELIEVNHGLRTTN